jgi:acyl-CoA thioesterase
MKIMKTIDELRSFFGNDRFAIGQGITIDCVSEDRATCSLTRREDHLNALGSAQGGLIYTLADFTFAVAANVEGVSTVTLNTSIHYLRGPKGKILTATAVRVHQTRSTCVYDVEVTDDLGTPVAKMSATGFRKVMP